MIDISEKTRIFLTKNVFSPVTGFPVGDWVRILFAQHLRISPRYIPRAIFTTASGIVNSLMRRREEREYSSALGNVEIPAPVFVLGHWRSGTTHLHNLLSQDPQFAFPTFYEATQPHTFLTSEDSARESKLVKLLSPKTRVIDNMQASFDAPMEDEVALCILTGLSPIMGWLFPRQADYFDKYLTFDTVSGVEVERWKNAFNYFLRKLTLKHNRRVILKSPPHTCRIRLLLELFPEARFVHIHRHPYEVFRSYQRSAAIMRQMLQLQQPKTIDFDQRSIHQYRIMYDKFFEQKQLIPEGRFAEVGFADLEQDPVGQLERIYDHLNLEAFANAKPLIENYLISIAGYRKSSLPNFESSLKFQIMDAWKRCFDEWGYST